MVVRSYPSKQSSRRQKTSRRKSRWLLLLLLAPIVCWLGYKQIRGLEKPEAVLVLGGSTSALERERFTAEFVRQDPDVLIWVSGGSPNKRYIERFFSKAGIDPSRLHLDYQAVDTVTNFTTLADELRSRGIHSIYLITSDYHMRRACIIAEIVLGSRGIVFKAVSVPTERSPEPIEKSIRDGARALLWVFTGRTGSTLSRFLEIR